MKHSQVSITYHSKAMLTQARKLLFVIGTTVQPKYVEAHTDMKLFLKGIQVHSISWGMQMILIPCRNHVSKVI